MKPLLIATPQKLSAGSSFTIYLLLSKLYTFLYPNRHRKGGLYRLNTPPRAHGEGISLIISQCCCSLDTGSELFAVTPLQSTTISVLNVSYEWWDLYLESHGFLSRSTDRI